MKNVFYLLMALGLLAGSCSKEADKPVIESKQIVINSTNSTTWKYFSFEKNDTVTIADPMTSKGWDLAFQRYRIKTNGGSSGSGLGSASNSFLKQQSGFDALKAVSDTATFVKDASIQIAVQQGYATYVVNPKLYTWFNIELGANGTQIVPTDCVFIVKTASGKYAKVWFKSYYNAMNVSGYVTFQYKYQPDGSKNLE